MPPYKTDKSSGGRLLSRGRRRRRLVLAAAEDQEGGQHDGGGDDGNDPVAGGTGFFGRHARRQCGLGPADRLPARNWRKRSDFGLLKTSFGGPFSSIRPLCRNIVCDDTSRAKPISWVTTSMVVPSSASWRMTRSTSPTSSGSRAEVGSSNSITLGSMASARAIAARCCCPPERWLG